MRETVEKLNDDTDKVLDFLGAISMQQSKPTEKRFSDQLKAKAKAGIGHAPQARHFRIIPADLEP